MTIALDGKTICSTEHMERYESPLHIVSAQVSEPGITFAQKRVNGKSSETPAVQVLIEQLAISRCMVVTNVLNYQTKRHRLPHVHFRENYCCVEEKNVQKNLNMFRKPLLSAVVAAIPISFVNLIKLISKVNNEYSNLD